MVKLSPCLIKYNVMEMYLRKHHTMKTYWRVEVQLHAFLTLALDVGEWSASCPSCFTSRGKEPHLPTG